MGHLADIIKNLNKEEIRYYKLYSKRLNYDKEHKTVRLFDYIKYDEIDENSQELVDILFKNGGRNPFYRLKNRLLNDLKKSILLQHIDLDEKVNILNLISYAHIFSYKTQFKQALHYLQKAEKNAIEHEHYDLLNMIYGEIITLASQFDAINPLPFIEKQRQNSHKYSIVRQANQAISAINYKLKKTNFSGKERAISKTLKRILDDLSIANEVYQLPKVKLKIHECVRNSILQSKDFQLLEKYLIDSLKEFEKDKVFAKVTQVEKILLVNWIINTSVKNRNFKLALKYSDKLHDELLKYNKLYYGKYIWTYYQSLIVNNYFSGDLKNAISVCEELKANARYKGNVFYDLGIYLNLASLNYCNNDFSLAIKNLSNVLVKEVYNNLSESMQLSISILEMILHYEQEDLDYPFFKLTEIRRQFKHLLKQDEYQIELSFLKIFNDLLKKPDPWKNKTILKNIQHYIENSPEVEPGSNEVVNYNAWLNSKLNNERYYDVILKMVSKKGK